MIITGQELAHAAPLVKLIGPMAIKAIGSSLNWTSDQVRLRLASTFSDHIESSRRKCSYVRTVNNPDVATAIEDMYVNLYLSRGPEVVEDDSMVERLRLAGRVIIAGTAGAGKSMLLRYLYLKVLETNDEILPLFLELRDFSITNDHETLENVFRLVTPESQRSNKGLFWALAEKVGLCLFLDGLDEVSPESRPALRASIEDMLVRFPKIKVLISSRPDVDFMGWEQFDLYRIDKLLPFQSKLIVEKAAFYDEPVRLQFIEKLEKGEFDQHKSFLEIALLNVILLMCYGEHLELSEKFSTFYDQAYEVLYRRHDRVKGLRRKHYANLAADDFKKLVTAFCYRTFADYALSFTEGELSRYLNKAAKIVSIEADAGALSQDMTESVSLLQRDGSKIFFIHRSFQEYFSARFMIEYRGEENFKVFDVIFVRPQSTRIAAIVGEIALPIVEREWVLPTLDRILARIDQLSPGDELIALSFIYASFNISKFENKPFSFGGFSWDNEKSAPYLAAISAIYGDRLVSDTYLFEDRPVGIGDMTFDEYLERGESEDALAARKALSNSDGKSYAALAVNADERLPDWVAMTDIVERLGVLIARLRSIRAAAASRLEQRAKSSIFD